ncbi:unnamed protein product [Parajaminaea phylloscopi]
MDQLDQERLVRDLLPSPPIYDSDGTRVQAFRRDPVMVGDLKNRVCWICQDGDEDEAQPTTDDEAASASGSGSRTGSTGRQEGSKQARSRRRRRFVHPCKCTLIAHESCLLRWIYRKATPTRPMVSCPQCAHPYTIYSPKPLSLRSLEKLDKAIGSVTRVGGAGLVVGGVATCCATYSYFLLEKWMGKAVAGKILGPGWFWEHGLALTTVPPFLMWLASPLSTSQAIFAPATLVWPLSKYWVLLADGLPWAERCSSSLASETWSVSFPPGPGACIVLLPCVRFLWRIVYHGLTRSVLSRFLIPRQSAGPSTATRPDEPGRGISVILNNRRTQLLFDVYDQSDDLAAPRLVDAANVDDEDDIARVLPEESLDAEFLPADRDLTIRVTGTSICRFMVHTLALPFAACFVGQALQAVALKALPKGNWLERLLALQGIRAAGAASFLGAAAARRKDTASSLGLFSSESTSRHWAARALGGGAWYMGQPSLHWCNTLSLCLCVVGRDVAALAYRYLRLRQHTRTRVVDRPFEGSLVDGLDLR